MLKIRALAKGDIRFQMRYGFYFVYFVILVLYAIILPLLPTQIAETIGTALIFSDPGAMGMFFMGAIILLEKSERVLNSIAVSPVTAAEYMMSKIISFGIISTLVGVMIFFFKESVCNRNVWEEPWKLAGTAVSICLTSVLFTLFGIFVGTKAKTLNEYLIMTLPFELIGFVPPIAYLFGVQRQSIWMKLYPGNGLILWIHGETQDLGITIIISFIWIVLLFFLVQKSVKSMFQSVGGVSL